MALQFRAAVDPVVQGLRARALGLSVCWHQPSLLQAALDRPNLLFSLPFFFKLFVGSPVFGETQVKVQLRL